jgi:predicted metallopeptidase
MAEFVDAKEEFLPIAEELYEKHQQSLNLTVEPSLVMFLRSDSRRKAFAYAKRVTDEYELLTDKKYFIVIINKYFNLLRTDEERKYVLLHEMMHLFMDENGKYKLLDHNLKEFKELLKNPEWNLLLVSDGIVTQNEETGEVKIGIDFNFNDKKSVSDLKKKLKEEDKNEEEAEEIKET